MDFSNGNGFHGSNGFPRPMLTRLLGQSEVIPARPSPAPAHTIPLEAWPLAGGVALLAGGFFAKGQDTKAVLFGLGSTLAGVSTVALFAKL